MPTPKPRHSSDTAAAPDASLSEAIGPVGGARRHDHDRPTRHWNRVPTDASTLPVEGTASLPRLSAKRDITMVSEDEAVTAAVRHSIKFQALMKRSMEKMEQRFMDNFMEAMGDMANRQNIVAGRLSSASATDAHQEDGEVEQEHLSGPFRQLRTGYSAQSVDKPLRSGALLRTIVSPGESEDGGMMRTSASHARSRDEAQKKQSSTSEGSGGGRQTSKKVSTKFFRGKGFTGRVDSEMTETKSSGSRVSDIKERYKERAQTLAAWIVDRQRGQSAVGEALWQFMEDPESSALAWAYDRLNIPFICITAIFSLAQIFDGSSVSGNHAFIVETVIDSLFLLEVLLRFWVLPNRRHFLFDAYNVIDLLNGLVLGIRIAVVCHGRMALAGEAWVPILFFAYVPILRLLKVLRRFRQFHLLLKAFRLAAEALPVMLFCYVVCMLTFAALLYTFERDNQNIDNWAEAVWLAAASMTTVGFGDVSPKSVVGKMITGVLTIASNLYMAVPLGIIGNCFHEVWSDRDRILLVQMLHRRLRQWGYTATDVPKLFQDFDIDGDDRLDFNEFKHMVDTLRLGLSAERTVQLFNALDSDHGGNIDDKEFVRVTFPTAYHQIFGQNDNMKARNSITDNIKEMVFASSLRLLSPNCSEWPPPSSDTASPTAARGRNFAVRGFFNLRRDLDRSAVSAASEVSGPVTSSLPPSPPLSDPDDDGRCAVAARSDVCGITT